MPNLNPPPPLNIGNGLGLPEGQTPKIIPMLVDLTVNPSWTVDLTQQQQQNNIGPIQTIYINNSGNAQPVTVVALVSNISYTILPGDSAILPFFLPGQAPKFTVSSTGGVVVPIAVLDTPQPAQVWGSSTNAGFNFTAGKLQVTDVALDALISNLGGAGNALNVNVLTLPDGFQAGTPFSLIAGNGTPVGLVSALARKLTHIEGFNNGTTPAYLKLYDTSTAPTAGAGTPAWRTLIPGGADGSGFIAPIPPTGISLTNGLGYAITGGIADNDTTNIAAATFLINLAWAQ